MNVHAWVVDTSRRLGITVPELGQRKVVDVLRDLAALVGAEAPSFGTHDELALLRNIAIAAEAVDSDDKVPSTDSTCALETALDRYRRARAVAEWDHARAARATDIAGFRERFNGRKKAGR